MNHQEISVRFEVKKIRFRNEKNRYTVIEAKFTKYDSKQPAPTVETIISGYFPSVFVEDEFEGVGVWKNHPIYGYTFVLKNAKRIVPQTEKGIKEFLKRCAKGIGSKTAGLIVETFGMNTIRMIEADWRNLLKVPGIGEKRAKKIYENLITHKRFEEIALYALSQGASYNTAIRIYEHLGESAILRIKENPYILCTIPKIGFEEADKFGKGEHVAFHDMERVKYGILEFLDRNTKSKGNLYLEKAILVQYFNQFLITIGAYKEVKKSEYVTEERLNEALKQLLREEKIVIDRDIHGTDCIYLKSYHVIENQIVRYLKKLIEEPKPPIASTQQIEDFIKQYEEEHSFCLAQKQKDAVFMSLQNGMSILTGGPGTGKTQTINVIIKCIQAVKPNAVIHLCAPTGKASKRMTELTGMDAMTIHRTIGLNGFEADNQIHCIQGDFVIIDEASMIDAFVFYKLLEAIDENVRILFVGDYEQLPSVGPGLILRDLINSRKIPTTVLTEIFRQAQESQIVMNSHKIIQGIKTTDENGLTFDESKGDFYFIENKDRKKTQQYILASVRQFIQKYNYTLQDIQILSPMRKGDLGVWELNRLMQQKFNPPASDKKEYKVDEINLFREGDKVIQTVNNYDLEVFNGEVGYIKSIGYDKDGEPFVEVDYDDKVVVYDELSVEEMELAYVITIHKSQGSEFPIVIMPIHPSQEHMLNRNLIYTGWTRAKKVVVCVGTKESLDKAIERTDNTVRNSKIKDKIIRKIQPPLAS